MDSEPTLYGIWTIDTNMPIGEQGRWCCDGEGRIYLFPYRHQTLAHGRRFLYRGMRANLKYFLAKLSDDGKSILLEEITDEELISQG